MRISSQQVIGVGSMQQDDRRDHLEAAMAAVSDAVIIVDPEQRISYLNPAAESLTGWQSADAAGRPLAEVFFLVDTQDRPLKSPLVIAALSAEVAPPLLDATLVDRRGTPLAIEFSAMAVGERHGRFAGWVVVCRLRQGSNGVAAALDPAGGASADELFEERERAQVTLNSIGDAVISTNFSGRVSYLNVVAEKMTGWVQAEASGNAVDDIFQLVDATTRALIPCPTGRAIIENCRVALEAACVLRRRGGEELAVEVSASPIHDRNGGVIGSVMVAQDVTAARELSRRLERLALHDSLTDLPNRALFSERLGRAMAHARDHGGFVALLYVDLDRFKHVNDSLGHAIGDKLLQTVARRLSGCVRSTDTVSRQGGDEFVIVLADIARVADAVSCADKILSALEAPFVIGEHELTMSASIGVAIFPDDAADVDALLRCADHAMYQAKYNGRNNFKLFAPGAGVLRSSEPAA